MLPMHASRHRPASEALQSLRNLTAQFPQGGRLEAIWVRTQRRGDMRQLDCVSAEAGRGLLGDHRASVLRDDLEQRRRELTLIQAEHLPLIAQWIGHDTLNAGLLRRNLVISGINLLGLRSPFADTHNVWQLGGTVLLEITGPCDPCSRMEALLGPGGYNAMRGHGGLTARLLRGGPLRVGDVLRPFA